LDVHAPAAAQDEENNKSLEAHQSPVKKKLKKFKYM